MSVRFATSNVHTHITCDFECTHAQHHQVSRMSQSLVKVSSSSKVKVSSSSKKMSQSLVKVSSSSNQNVAVRRERNSDFWGKKSGFAFSLQRAGDGPP